MLVGLRKKGQVGQCEQLVAEFKTGHSKTELDITLKSAVKDETSNNAAVPQHCNEVSDRTVFLKFWDKTLFSLPPCDSYKNAGGCIESLIQYPQILLEKHIHLHPNTPLIGSRARRQEDIKPGPIPVLLSHRGQGGVRRHQDSEG
eukprot:g42507.t1